MAWTTPRTWVTGEVVTAAIMNTHVRDNLNFLKTVGALTKLTHATGSSSLTLSTTITDVTGPSITHTTSIDDAAYLAIGIFLFRVSSTSAAVIMRGYMNTSVDGDLNNHGRLQDNGNDTEGTISQVWRGTIGTAGSKTWKLRGDKDAAGGTHQIVGTGETRIVLAVFE